MRPLALILVLVWAAAAQAEIVSSEIIEDHAQRDGRRHVREQHTDHTGAVFEIYYMAPAAADVEAVMAARVPRIEAEQTRNEIAANVANALSDDAPAPTFNYSTAAQFSAALRAEYKGAKARDAYRIGWYIESFNLTNQQLQNLFGIGAGQVTAAQTKLDDLAASYEAMQEAVGQ